MKIRKYLYIIILSFISVWTAQAQPRLSAPEIYLGVHGGVLCSMGSWLPQIPGTDKVLNTVLLSGNGGLVFRYSQHKCCGLQIELNYMQRGWRETWERDPYPIRYTRRLDYVELPFLSHIYFGKHNFRGFLNLGPQIGYCVHESWSGTKNEDPTREHPQYEPIDKKFDWGIAGGLGFYYRNQRAGLFQLEARFNYSLGDYFNNSKAAYFDKSHAMNLSLNLAYMIQIRKRANKGRSNPVQQHLNDTLITP